MGSAGGGASVTGNSQGGFVALFSTTSSETVTVSYSLSVNTTDPCQAKLPSRWAFRYTQMNIIYVLGLYKEKALIEMQYKDPVPGVIKQAAESELVQVS